MHLSGGFGRLFDHPCLTVEIRQPCIVAERIKLTAGTNNDDIRRMLAKRSFDPAHGFFALSERHVLGRNTNRRDLVTAGFGGQGLVQFTLIERSQAVYPLGRLTAKFPHASQFVDRRRFIPDDAVGHCKVLVCEGKVRIQFQREPPLRECLLVAMRGEEDHRLIGIDHEIERIEGSGRLYRFDRLIISSQDQQEKGPRMIGSRKARVETDRRLQLFVGLTPVPLQRGNARHRRISLGQGSVDIYRTLSGMPAFDKGFCRVEWNVPDTLDIAFCQTCKGKSKVWVQCDRPFVVLNALEDPVAGPFVPEEAAFQVFLIGLAHRCVSCFWDRIELCLKCDCDNTSDGALKVRHIIE